MKLASRGSRLALCQRTSRCCCCPLLLLLQSAAGAALACACASPAPRSRGNIHTMQELVSNVKRAKGQQAAAQQATQEVSPQPG